MPVPHSIAGFAYTRLLLILAIQGIESVPGGRKGWGPVRIPAALIDAVSWWRQ